MIAPIPATRGDVTARFEETRTPRREVERLRGSAAR
jgi:hypothetical protein